MIRSIDRIPEYLSRAYHVAQSGRPGPVVLGLPEDMLSSLADVADAKPARLPAPTPSAGDMSALEAALAKAQRPVMMIGGPGWSEEIRGKVEAFAARASLPVAAAFRYQDYFDNRHPCYAGHAGIGPDPKLAAAIKGADLLITVGARLGEMTTGAYALIDVPNPKQTLVHVHPDGNELGTVYRAELPIIATAATFAEALDRIAVPKSPPWAGLTRELHASAEAMRKPIPTPGNVRFEEVLRQLSDQLPEDAIVCNGAGNYAAFLHRYFQYKRFRTELAPTSGSMGYGLPAAVAAKLAHPERTVVNFAGDGCFMMTSQELATAVQYGLPIVTIIANNGMFGTIRMHQERHYPSRVSGTTLINPDFAAMARSFGAHGETVERTADFAAAFERSLASGTPAVIELRIDPEALTPRQTLSQIRAAATPKG